MALAFGAQLLLGIAILAVIITVMDPGPWRPGLTAFDYGLMGLYLFAGGYFLTLYRITRQPVQLTMAIVMWLFIPYMVVGQSPWTEWRLAFYPVWLLLFAVGGPIRKRNLSHHRQVLELAARRVESTAGGYTGRPYPLSTAPVDPGTLERFAAWMMREGIAVRYRRGATHILAIEGFSWRHHLSGTLDPSRMTAVTIDPEGHVAVFIRSDVYNRYRERFTFDELCQALGSIILECLADYRAGRERDILERIDAEMDRSHWFHGFLATSPTHLPEGEQ